MRLRGLFGIEFEFINRVVKIKVPGGRTWFAVQLEDGSMLGQKWEENGDRTYPIYKTRLEAEKALAKALLAHLQPPKQ